MRLYFFYHHSNESIIQEIIFLEKLKQSEMSEDNKDTGETPKKYPLITIRGLLFPEPFLVPSTVEQAIDFKPSDTDIFVVTYPKCGTTWMQFMVWEIVHKGAVPPSPNQMMFCKFPFLELISTDVLKDMLPPRLMKTHLPFNLQPYNPKAKYIYVVRNPWDVCVSYYNHHKIDPAMGAVTFEDYFECFITGEIGWGDFFDHVLSWFKHRNDPNVLFLSYENMKKDKRKALFAVAKFLGQSYYESLQNSEEIVQNCLKHTTFEYMKGLGMFFPKGEPEPDMQVTDMEQIWKKMGSVDRNTADPEEYTEVNFFRKGEVGDWKNHFTQTQINKFNEYMLRKLKNTEMENYWQPVHAETSL